MRWILLSLLFCACDDGAVADDPEVLDAGGDAALDAGRVDGGPRSPVDAALDAIIMGGADAGGADAGSADAGLFDDCPADEPPQQTVTFVVRNTAATPRFVPLAGDLCRPFVMRDMVGDVVPRRVRNVCSAECQCIAGTPESWATRYVALAPGETHTFSWDAQFADRCEREVFCPEFEGRGRDPRFTVSRTVWRNVSSAAFYRFELAYETALPEGCDDPMACQGPIGAHWFGRCEAGQVSTTEFLLGAAAETTVEIELP